MPICPVDLSATEVARRLAQRSGFAWLDSNDVETRHGRHSFLASDPTRIVRSSLGDANPLSVLGDLTDVVSSSRVPRWIGLIAFDTYWHTASSEAHRQAARRHERSPEALAVWFAQYDATVVVDHLEHRVWIDAESDAALSRIQDRLRAMPEQPSATVSNLTQTDREDHGAVIRTALEHISAGDIYQVNLARRWHGQFAGHPLALYEAMREASPVPLGAYINTGDITVLSRSMETFLHFDASTRVLSTRPIKGTIARSGKDQAEASALRADPKEQAEHTMIVDLMRNDLGRVAEIGSVDVQELMSVEPYAKLAHLVSTVRCQVPARCTLADIYAATFPPGSVTGAPKVRALEIIEALEPHPRGVYCGAVGYVAGDGSAHFTVAIRTAQVSGREITYHAGGGIVTASDATKEILETDLKARVFLDALSDAGE